MLYKETDKLLEVADFLFDMQQIEKAEVIYNLVEEKRKERLVVPATNLSLSFNPYKNFFSSLCTCLT